MSGIQPGGGETPQDDSVVTGTLASNGATVEISTEDRATVIAIYPTAISAFVVPQGTADDVTWYNLVGYPVSSGEAVSILTANVPYVIPCAGWIKVRLTSAFWTAGSTAVTLTASIKRQRDALTAIARTSQPTALGSTVQGIPGVNKYGMLHAAAAIDTLVEWGKVFRVTTNYVSTGAAPETAFMLLRNPAGYGISIKILGITFQVPVTGSVEYRVYRAPTVTAVGTALTPVGNRQTGQAAAVGLMYRLPTIAANGTLTNAVHLQNTTTPHRDDSGISRWLDAGNDMLITVEKSGAGVLTCVTVDYVEQA